MSKLRAWLGMALVALLLVVVVQNLAMVEVQVLVWTIAMPRALLVVLCLALGALAGRGWFGLRRWKAAAKG